MGLVLMRRVTSHGESVMPHEHTVGILTGLVLVASVLVMIASLDRAARTLRGPLAYPRTMVTTAHIP
jgi:hypothetical protein